MKRLRALLPLFVLVAIGLAVLLGGGLERFDPHRIAQQELDWRAAIEAHPLLAALVQIGVVAGAIATGVPGAIVLVLAGGMLFGFVEGTVLSSIGTTLGATVLFFASRSAFAHGEGQLPAWAERVRAGYHAYPVSYAMFLRLVPAFPFGAVTVVLAALGCPFWLFLVTAAAGGSVMIAFESALGAGLSETIARQGTVSLNVFSHPDVLLPLLGMATLALAPVVLAQLRRLGDRRTAAHRAAEPAENAREGPPRAD